MEDFLAYLDNPTYHPGKEITRDEFCKLVETHRWHDGPYFEDGQMWGCVEPTGPVWAWDRNKKEDEANVQPTSNIQEISQQSTGAQA